MKRGFWPNWPFNADWNETVGFLIESYGQAMMLSIVEAELHETKSKKADSSQILDTLDEVIALADRADSRMRKFQGCQACIRVAYFAELLNYAAGELRRSAASKRPVKIRVRYHTYAVVSMTRSVVDALSQALSLILNLEDKWTGQFASLTNRRFRNVVAQASEGAGLKQVLEAEGQWLDTLRELRNLPVHGLTFSSRWETGGFLDNTWTDAFESLEEMSDRMEERLDTVTLEEHINEWLRVLDRLITESTKAMLIMALRDSEVTGKDIAEFIRVAQINMNETGDSMIEDLDDSGMRAPSSPDTLPKT